MATTPLNTIKNWFKTGLKPTQAQFWATWDSFWHKDEPIPQSSIQNLGSSLYAKADAAGLSPVATSGDYSQLNNKPVIRPVLKFNNLAPILDASLQLIVDNINFNGFTVSSGDIIIFSIRVQETLGSGFNVYRYSYLFARTHLTGTWGTGSANGPVNTSDLLKPTKDLLFTTIEPNIINVNLADIGASTIEDYINGFAGDFAELTANTIEDDGNAYYFYCTINGTDQVYHYTGAVPRIIGDANPTLVDTDFDLIASSATPPDLNDYLLRGGYTGTAQDLKDMIDIIGATPGIISVNGPTVDNTDPDNPIVNLPSATQVRDLYETARTVISQAEVETGTETTVRLFNALRVKQAIDARIAEIIDGSPGTLDTLNEIAAALGDDPNFAATMTAALAGKQPLDATLTALAALVGSADKLPYFTGDDTLSLADLTAYGRTLIALADAAGLRTNINVEDGATADQTGAEIKTALFAESDTNNLTDTLLAKLNALSTTKYHEFACSDEDSDLAVGRVYAQRLLRAFNNCTKFDFGVETAPTGSTITVDVKKNGTTVFTTKATIDATEFTTLTAATAQVISGGSVSFAAGDLLEIYLDVVGSTVPGKNLKAQITYS